MLKDKNVKVLILEVIVIVLAVVGITLAISYVMNAININATGANLAVDYTGSLTLPSTSLFPIADSEVSSNTENVMRVNFSIKGSSSNDTSEPIIYDVILSDLNIGCELKSNYLKWQLNKNGTKISEGSFDPTFDIMKDNKLWLTTIQQDLPSSSATADSYEFILWLSEACSDVTSCTQDQDQSNMLGKTISGKIETLLYTNSKKELVREVSNTSFRCPNAPTLADGMIPVTYSNDKWVKADSTNTYNNWYSYEEKKWANAVLVTDTNRSTYQSASAGTEIVEDDILAYYVWIPRYKYKVWNITKTVGTDSYDAYHTGIDIVFESGKESTGTITCNYDFTITDGSLSEICSGTNNEYYTHPAFTFGDTEVEGIWVGKFEVSSSNPTASYGGGYSASLTVRVKPNVTSWRVNLLSNFSYVIQNMQITDNEYGLTTDKTVADSHMMKNMEWGAVAYLTNSNYGRCSDGTCSEVAINSYDGYKTGCGPQSAGSTSDGSTCNAYTTVLGQLASTTGNVYGIYDMSGGAIEYVMGNMSSGSGSYTYSASNAGSNFTYSEETAKYLDTYAYGYGASNTDQTAYNRARLGDATGENVLSTGENVLSTGETGGWYSDYPYFISSSGYWFARGGNSFNGTNAGAFLFSDYLGGTGRDCGARCVVVLP